MSETRSNDMGWTTFEQAIASSLSYAAGAAIGAEKVLQQISSVLARGRITKNDSKLIHALIDEVKEDFNCIEDNLPWTEEQVIEYRSNVEKANRGLGDKTQV